MKFFLIPFVSGLLIVGGINLYVDPTHRWWSADVKLNENLSADQCYVTPSGIDERYLRNAQIPKIEEITFLGLGSSRFMNVDSDMVGDPGFYNASVSGASIWDYIAFWQLVKSNGKVPKKVAIFVDTWVFNQNTWNKYRWTVNFPAVLRFLFDAKAISLAWDTTVDWFNGTFSEFSELFSPKVSLKELRSSGRKKVNFVTLVSQKPAEYAAWKRDGSKLYASSDEVLKTSVEINEIGRNVKKGAMNAYLAKWTTDPLAIDLFTALLEDLERLNVEVILVQPPFQHETYRILLEKDEFKDIPQNFDSIMDSVTDRFELVRYCNVIDPHIARCSDIEFMDSSHTHRTCAEKIVSYCFGGTRLGGR